MSKKLIRLSYDQQIIDLEWRKTYKALHHDLIISTIIFIIISIRIIIIIIIIIIRTIIIDLEWQKTYKARKGTHGLSTNGVTANSMFFDRGTCLVLPLSYFYLPKSAKAHLFPILSKIITFAAAPLVLTPFVRNQIIIIMILS